MEVQRMKYAILMYSRKWRAKKNRIKTLCKKFSKSENLLNLIKIQSFIRGYSVRERHQAVIQKIKREAPKKTRKY
jgi:hypothetical protein